MGCFAKPEDLFLNLGKALVSTFYSKIATSNHDPGSLVEDRLLLTVVMVCLLGVLGINLLTKSSLSTAESQKA
jgi:hypothetical protein